MSCFSVLELRNSPAITRIPRLESEHFNHNLFDPDLIRGSLVINLEQLEAEKAIKLITSLGLQARLPVDPMDFTVESIRESWIENKNMLVFTFYDPKNPVLIIDVFVREPIPFAELSKKALMLDLDGEPVPVCDIEHLIAMKKKQGEKRI